MRATALIFGVLPLLAIAGQLAWRSTAGSLSEVSQSPNCVALNETVPVPETSSLPRFETPGKDPAVFGPKIQNSHADANVQIANPKLEGVLSLEIESPPDLPLTGGFGVDGMSFPNVGLVLSRYFVASPSAAETFRSHEPEKWR